MQGGGCRVQSAESERARCVKRRRLSGWEKKSVCLREEVFLWTGELCNGNDEII